MNLCTGVEQGLDMTDSEPGENRLAEGLYFQVSDILTAISYEFRKNIKELVNQITYEKT